MKFKAVNRIHLTTAVFLLLNAVLLLSLRVLHKEARASVALEKNPSLEEPSCRQIYGMAQWAVKRHGGKAKVDLTSKKFAEKVMEKYLDRLDPFKLIYTQDSVEGFRKASVEAWRGVVDVGSCDYFVKTVAGHAQRARDTISARVRSLPTEVRVEGGHHDLQYLYDRLPVYDEFAGDVSELRARWGAFAHTVLQHSGTAVLAAYGYNSRETILDTFEQLSYGENQSPKVLLAKAMLASLDPYSTFFPEAEFEDFYADLAGAASGVGIRVRKVPSGLLVEKVLQDSPAGRTKQLREGDLISQIDGKNLSILSALQCKRLLKGKESTAIQLKLLRGAGKNPKVFDVKLKRETLTFDEARIDVRYVVPKANPQSRVAVITVPSFYGRGGFGVEGDERSSAEDLERAVKSISSEKKKPSAILLDLRGNPGGYLEEAVAMAGVFIGDKPVVGVVEQSDRRILRDTKAAIYGGPLVVLIDKESASAAEVLAGALKDNMRALVLGDEASFGKGTVQRLFDLSEEAAVLDRGWEEWTGVVKLTTSIFYSPKGHSPANGGVKPHLVLHNPSKSEKDEDVTADEREEKKRADLQPVPEESPFLQDSELTSISKQEKSLETTVARLREKLHTEPNAAALAKDEADPTVFEAVQIASDFSALQ